MVPLSRQFILSFVVVTLALGAIPLMGAGGSGLAPPVEVASATEEGDIDDADTATIAVTVDENGTADWTVEYRYILDDEEATESFERVQERIEESPDTYEERFRNGIMETAEVAMQETGREMSVSAVAVEAGKDPIPQASGEHGVVSYTFEWEGFASADNDSLEVGDAIHGFYLSPETALVINWPESYELADGPQPSGDDEDSNRVLWEGEERFSSSEPSVTLEESEEIETTEENDSGQSQDSGEDDQHAGDEEDSSSGSDDESPPSTDSDSPDSGQSMLPFALAALGIIAAGSVGLIAARRSQLISIASGTESTTEDSSKNPASELLSNEERVIAALEAEGGRIKQKQLAKQCDWHPSKTSKVVTSLKEDGVINVFRIGRENIITHPDEQLGHKNPGDTDE